MALEVKIRKKLAKFTLDVDFCVENEVFALLGASGCGKSMTLKCIAGIEQPDEGYIILNGRTLYDSHKKINLPPQKRKVGYMFQDYALFPNMTVKQNIMAGMGKRPDLQLVEGYMETFHVKELENQYPSQLSGGQKQRVAMARMLAAAPEVILLDEPFSALDSHLRWELEQQMRQTLHEVQKPTVFVSHNRDEVYRMCAVVSCINEGKMEVVEPVKEFFHNPKTRTAAILSGCKNISGVKIVQEEQTREQSAQSIVMMKATDWGVTLRFSNEEVKEDTGEIQAVGIRAHYLIPKYEEAACEVMSGKNLLPVKEYQMIEDSFEWILLFKASDDGNWLQWKVAKSQTQEQLKVPDYFQIDGKNVLFLRD